MRYEEAAFVDGDQHKVIPVVPVFAEHIRSLVSDEWVADVVPVRAAGVYDGRKLARQRPVNRSHTTIHWSLY